MQVQYFKEPFDHWVIDDFMAIDVARELANDFVDFNHKDWYTYDNPLEIKKTLNNWWNFPPVTYSMISYLNSRIYIEEIQKITGHSFLHEDPGLHGAGWHIHGNGGKLNVHLDYSIHPKMNLERKLNLIYYLSEDWDPAWGGNLEFWRGTNKKAEYKVKQIDCLFNRAIIFDTTQNSWHGFPERIQCPEGKYRKSIALYYLTHPADSADPARRRAYYSPAEDQKDDPSILELIESRVKA